jgi:hypothetical protein
MCEVERTLRRTLTAPKTVVRPESLVYKLKSPDYSNNNI